MKNVTLIRSLVWALNEHVGKQFVGEEVNGGKDIKIEVDGVGYTLPRHCFREVE